jgi:hypothetical protein
MTTPGHPCTLVYTFVRLRPKLAAQHPSIPSDTWHPVRTWNPGALCPQAEPGLVWVDVEGRLRKLPTHYFEFTTSNTW